jgi:hypothetical protein
MTHASGGVDAQPSRWRPTAGRTSHMSPPHRLTPPDTQVTDIQVADTQVADTQVADTQVADTQVADTQVADIQPKKPTPDPSELLKAVQRFVRSQHQLVADRHWTGHCKPLQSILREQLRLLGLEIA